MKTCPFCAEEIQDEAIKCNYCNKWLSTKTESTVTNAEQFLRESEARYRELANSLPQIIFEADVKGNITFANETIFAISGYSVEEFTKGMNLLQLVIPDDRERLIVNMEKVLSGEKSKNNAYSAIKKDGTIFPAVIRSVPIVRDNRVVGFRGIGIDVTDLKSAQDALKESEERYRGIIENIVDVYYRSDLEGRITMFSPSALNLFGYGSLDDLIGKNIAETFYFKPEERSKVLSALKEKGEVKDFEVTLKHKDGSPIPMSVSSRYYYNENREILGIEGILRDIRERKQFKENFRRSIEESPLGIRISNAEGDTLYFNPSFLNIYGYNSLEELEAVPAESRFTPKSFAEYLQRKEYRKRGDYVPPEYDVSIVRKDGEVRHFRVNRKEILWNGEKQIQVLYSDITDRRLMEDALRENEERFRGITSNLPGIVYQFYAKSSGEYGISYVAGPLEEFWGITADTANFFLSFLSHVYEEDRDPFMLSIQKAVDTCTPWHYEGRFIKPTGEMVWFQGMSTPRRYEDHVVFDGILLDITDRKRIEEEKRNLQDRLHRAEKMEALGIMAGGVAHDLNNVLGIVVGYADMLLMNSEASSPIRSQLTKIMDGGQKAAAIIQDMLTLARRGVASTRILNLNTIVAECQQSPEFSHLASYHPLVQVKTDLAPDLLNASGSSVHLEKTLFNLVSNAAEAMPKGGVVTIKTSNQYLDKPIQGYDHIQEGNYVVLSVSDMGEGISESDLKHIFEPFYTKKVMGRSGTGLGLAVVWGTVKDHDGYINVSSKEGKGSTFTFYLPALREDIVPEVVADIPTSQYMGKGESILIVDDVDTQRYLAADILKKLNYSVTTASSGEEAVAYLKNHPVDLVVLDMIMDPGMDGLDTYKNIVVSHPHQKAIIVSGFSESDRVKDAQALGAGAYVKKPYIMRILGQAVKKELEQK